MIDFRELACFYCFSVHSVSGVRNAVQLSGLAARVHRTLTRPSGAICPWSDLGADVRCFAIPGAIEA